MWFDWLLRRWDMGAFAIVSPLQQPLGLDRQGSEIINLLSVSDAINLVNRQKAERKVPHHYVFSPSLFLTNSVVFPNELVTSPKSVVRSPSFDISSCKDLSYHAGPGRLKASSISLLGSNSNSETKPAVSDQQHAKYYLQIVQELKQSRFNNGYETLQEPEQLLPRYWELKAGFWKRLASNTRNNFHKEKNSCDSSSLSGVCASEAKVVELANGIGSNSNACCKRNVLRQSKGNQNRRGGPLDKGVNKSMTTMEIQVVLTGKRNGNTLGELRVPKLKFLDDAQQAVSNVQNTKNNPCDTNDAHYHIMVNDPVRDGLFQSPSTAAYAERDQYEDVYRIANHQQQQQKQQKTLDGSICSFSTGGGIGRGHIIEDGSPMSTSSNRQLTCEDWKTSVENFKGTKKEEDGTFWSGPNWCMVDSYMTSDGKETTWTVRGFEEDDGIVEEKLFDNKDWRPLKIFANENNHSCYASEFSINNIPVEGSDVETRHGLPPKWTQKTLQEQVAKNLREQQKKLVWSTKNGLEIIKNAHKQVEEDCSQLEREDGGKEEAKCREVVFNDLLSVSNMSHCRKGTKLLKEGFLTETSDKIGGGNIEETPYMNDVQSACISASWKSMRYSSNTCISQSSAYGSNQELSNSISIQNIWRHKRRWIKKRKRSPAIAICCCVSMIGNYVKALHRMQKNTAASGLKLAELRVGEVKELEATASKMRIHLELLQFEIQELQTEREFSVLVIFPWQQFLRNIMIGISLISGTIGLYRAIKSLFRLLSGRAGLVQIATFKEEKLMVAMVIICSGSYVGNDMWKIFSHVQATKKTNEALYQEKLHHILERLSSMITLAYKDDYHLHQGQAEEKGEII